MFHIQEAQELFCDAEVFNFLPFLFIIQWDYPIITLPPILCFFPFVSIAHRTTLPIFRRQENLFYTVFNFLPFLFHANGTTPIITLPPYCAFSPLYLLLTGLPLFV